jgi:iron complex outermembrane recepter protein
MGGKTIGAVLALTLVLAGGQPDRAFGQEATDGETAAEATPDKDADKGQHKMADVVVTATRTEVEADKAPASVSIITREDMERQNMRTADDALRYEAGVYTRRGRGVQDPSASSTVSMRGLSQAKRTLILVDGIPFNDGYSSGVTWSSIPVDSIERIEIIRGPGSALYGGNAMGGVINIILRVPMKTEAMARGGIGGGTSHAAGTNTSITNSRWGANAGTRLDDKASMFVGYEGEATSGYPASPVVKSATTAGTGTLSGGYPTQSASGTPSWIVGNSGNNFGQRQAANALIAYDLTDTSRLRADVLYGYQYYDYGSPESYVGGFSGTVSAYPGRRTGSLVAGNFLAGLGETEDLRLGLSYDGMPSDVWRIKTSLAFFREFNRYTSPTSTSTKGYDNAPGTLSNNTRDSIFFDLQNDFTLTPTNTLTLGGGLRTNSVSLTTDNLAHYRTWDSVTGGSDESSGMSNNWAAYVQDEWKLPGKVTLYGGARLDYWVTYNGRSGNVGSVQSIAGSDRAEISPRVSAVWNPLDDTFLRAGVSKGFRAPNLYEMLRSWTSAGTSPITYLPNPNLKPETLWTYEIGLTQYFWDRRVKLGAAAFHTDFYDYIDSVNVSSNVKRQENIGRLEINGLEFEGQFKPWNCLTLWGNLTLNEPKVTKFDLYPQYNGKYVTSVPLTQANLGADVTWREFKASLYGNYAGRVYANNDNNDVENVYGGNTCRWLWDAKVTYSPTKYMDISLSVQNIFDQEYYQYYLGSPRTYMVEMRFKY